VGFGTVLDGHKSHQSGFDPRTVQPVASRFLEVCVKIIINRSRVNPVRKSRTALFARIRYKVSQNMEFLGGLTTY